jgi:hypothetical protein
MVKQLFDAIKAGRELADPAAWKNRQNTINALVALLAAAITVARVCGLELPITDELLQTIAEAVAVALGGVNLYLTTATSKKIGV